MTRLLLLRHGQSEWNAVGKWQGQADPPLTALGVAQATEVAPQLPTFDLLASSSLMRAHKTALTIGAHYGIDHDDVVVEPRLMERDAGGFSGLTRDDIADQYPGYLESGRWPEGWEDDAPLVARVLAGIDAIVADQPDDATVVIVTHGGCIYALEASLGATFERIGNLGGSWFTLADGTVTMAGRVHFLNEETVPDQI